MEIYERATPEVFLLDGKIEKFWVIGKRKNPAFLIIPGFTGTHGDLLQMTYSLRDKFFLILPDMPGWGDSSRLSSSLTIDRYATYLKQLLDYMGINSLHIFGHCMGVAVSIELAYKFPDYIKSLTLVSAPYTEGLLSGSMFLYFAHLSKHMPQSIRPLLFFWRSRIFTIPLGYFVIKTKTLHKKLRILINNFIKQGKQNEGVLEENWISLMDFNYKKIKSIKAPVHFIHGAQDIIIAPKQAKKLHSFLPSATFDLISNAGHVPPIETPDTLARLILKYAN